MTTEQEDPVLVEQARNRKAINAMLARHGWQFGAVRTRERGTILAYELTRTADGKLIEHRVLLSDMLFWNACSPAPDDLAPLAMLGLALVQRVRQYNAEHPAEEKS